MLGRLVEEVLLGADARLQAHHDRLADRVDRRVRHLREQLLEVRVDEPVAIGEHREGRVVAHRADRLLGVARERRQDHLHVLERVAERDLPLAQRLGRHRVRHPRRQVGEPHDLAVEPLAVRLLGGDPALDLVVRDDPSLLEIDEEELARLQPALAEDVRGRDVEHARLGGEHDPAVARLEPATGPQAVAVERRADHAPVGERHRRGAVPRLHQALVVGVEPEQLAAAGRRARPLPRGSSSSSRAAASGRRARAARARCRTTAESEPPAWTSGSTLWRSSPKSSDASCDSRARIQLMLPRTVLISPLWAIIRYGWASSQLGNVLVENREWTSASARRGALVLRGRGSSRGAAARSASPCRRSCGTRSSGRSRRCRPRARTGGGSRTACARTHPGRRARPRRRRRAAGRAARTPPRCGRRTPGRPGRRASRRRVWPFVLDDRREQLLELVPALGRRGGRSTSRRRSGPAAGSSSRDDGAEERVGDLQQDPGTVARARIGARGAAMLEVRERLERPPHGLVQRLRVESRDERDAAGVVLVLGPVEALLGRTDAAHRVTPVRGWNSRRPRKPWVHAHDLSSASGVECGRGCEASLQRLKECGGRAVQTPRAMRLLETQISAQFGRRSRQYHGSRERVHPGRPARPTLRIRGTAYPVLLPTVRDPRLHLAAVIISLQVLGQTAFDFQLSIAQILVSLAHLRGDRVRDHVPPPARDHVARERAPDRQRRRLHPARAGHRARRLVEHEGLVDLRRHGRGVDPLEARDHVARAPLLQPVELRPRALLRAARRRRGPTRSPSGGGRCRRGWRSRS